MHDTYLQSNLASGVINISMDMFPLLPEMAKVSIILPIRNEERYIAATLETLAAQSYPQEFLEVIVADGQSNDDSLRIIQAFAAKHPKLRCQIIANEARIFSTGFNLGLEKARGDIILMLGGHTHLHPDYVERSVHHLRMSKAACVGGILNTIGESAQAEAIALAMSSRFGVGGVAFRVADSAAMSDLQEVDTVAFGAYRREVFDFLGGLDTELVRNQDDEFNYRLRKYGGRILLAPDMRANYYSRGTLRKLWRQYFEYGYWKVRVLQKHPRQMRLRQFAPPLLAASVICGLVLTMFHQFFRVVWLFGTISYVLVNLMFSMHLAHQHGMKHLRWLPLTFVTLHFAYGLGFLKGLIAFGHRFFGREAGALR